MTTMTRDEIIRAAKALPPDERLNLAREIANSAESEGAELPEAEWNTAWGDEAERRLAEIEDGKVTEIPGEEVDARVRAILGC
jgi:putative addiction module component (TIGR02574 family)